MRTTEKNKRFKKNSDRFKIMFFFYLSGERRNLNFNLFDSFIHFDYNKKTIFFLSFFAQYHFNFQNYNLYIMETFCNSFQLKASHYLYFDILYLKSINASKNLISLLHDIKLAARLVWKRRLMVLIQVTTRPQLALT